MSSIRATSPTEMDYLMKFRMAKKKETLEVMADKAEENQPPGIITAISVAYCHREDELEQGRLLD